MGLKWPKWKFQIKILIIFKLFSIFFSIMVQQPTTFNVPFFKKKPIYPYIFWISMTSRFRKYMVLIGFNYLKKFLIYAKNFTLSDIKILMALEKNFFVWNIILLDEILEVSSTFLWENILIFKKNTPFYRCQGTPTEIEILVMD